MSIMSKLTASYLAGLLDGEGCLDIRKRQDKYYVARVRITMVDEEMILWLKNSFGGNIHHREFKNSNCRDAYTWTVEGRQVVPILEKVKPYLRLKKQQAEILLEREKLKQRLINHGTTKGLEYPGLVLKQLDSLCQQLKVLNRRGKPLHAERLSEETPNREMR